jgi:type II secretory pathway predicted ATPase ExeA
LSPPTAPGQASPPLCGRVGRPELRRVLAAPQLHQAADRIVVEFLPPIAPGLERNAFMTELRGRLEPATARLVAEAQRQIAGG